MKSFQEFLDDLDEEACTTSSMGDASSDGTAKPKAKNVVKRKKLDDDEQTKA